MATDINSEEKQGYFCFFTDISYSYKFHKRWMAACDVGVDLAFFQGSERPSTFIPFFVIGFMANMILVAPLGVFQALASRLRN